MLSNKIPNLSTELAELRSMAPSGFVMVFGFSMLGTEFVHYEYSPKWREYYETHNLLSVDPVFMWCISRTGSTRWSEVTLPDVRGVLKKAEAFGLAYGVSFAKKSGRKRSLLSLAHNEREFTDAEIAFFEAKFSTWVALVMQNEKLSTREIDVLKGLNSGLGQRKIAEELGISESTVKQRAISACRKLDAKTRAQAVGIAAARNYL